MALFMNRLHCIHDIRRCFAPKVPFLKESGGNTKKKSGRSELQIYQVPLDKTWTYFTEQIWRTFIGSCFKRDPVELGPAPVDGQDGSGQCVHGVFDVLQ